jgi:hypothetical protein
MESLYPSLGWLTQDWRNAGAPLAGANVVWQIARGQKTHSAC